MKSRLPPLSFGTLHATLFAGDASGAAASLISVSIFLLDDFAADTGEPCRTLFVGDAFGAVFVTLFATLFAGDAFRADLLLILSLLCYTDTSP